jgi:multisubunit Na+/H+ antiporter MnhB subunit
LTDLAFDGLLSLLVLAVGAWSILARRAKTAVVVFVIYGLLLSLAWVRMAAVDVALTEAAIGSGVTGMLFLSAANRLAREPAAVRAPGRTFRAIVGLFCVFIALGVASLVFLLPAEPASLAAEVVSRLPDTGLGNPVAGVLFVYRAFDTMLEKVVLLIALLGVWSFAPDEYWGGVPGLRPFSQKSSVLLLLAQTLPPIGIIYAVYMTWVGADGPGGAFQGGTVLAAMWILVMLAGMVRVPPVRSPMIRYLLIAGPLVFLVIGVAGFFLADHFLAYPTGYEKPLIVAMEAALTLSIGVTLGLLVAGPPEAEAVR